MLVSAVCLCTILGLVYAAVRLLRVFRDPGTRRVCVVVLGDIGRSPRMQYHALSFVRAGFRADVIGYSDSTPLSALRESDAVRLVGLPSVPRILNKCPKLVSLLLKVMWQSVTLTLSLLSCQKSSHILLQNPPSLPAMSVCYFISLLRGSQLVIDWHNYGYTILALGLGPHHPLVRVYRFYEKFCGRLSAANICVTDAMRRDLLANWNVRAATMHDRPPEIFRSLSLEEKHRLFCKLHIFKEENAQSSNEETTLFTVRDRTEKDDKARFRTDRPVLLVSSTSWTEDEDFSILLSALDRYDQFSQTERSDFVAPKIICVITGKGPQKEFYMNEIRSRHWSQVTVHTPWLEAQDYPALLGCADLGVCLHKSSSGLDLPMKVVDMFGCGLPVCAVNFDCLDELVKNGENGLIFHNAEELTNQLLTLLKDFPHGCSELKRFRENLGTFQRLRWSECWTENVLPVFS